MLAMSSVSRRSRVVPLLAIALLAVACSNNKTLPSSPDAGRASGAVDGRVLDAGLEVGGVVDAESDGRSGGGEAGGPRDGQVGAETGGDVSPDPDAPTSSRPDADVDVALPGQPDVPLMVDSADDGDALVSTTCANGCLIAGLCYPTGVSNPSNPCQTCDVQRSVAGWSNNEGAACDDGKFCTVGDKCSAGVCAGSARNCSDGVACNGVETCDEIGDVCLAGSNTCTGNTVCGYQTGSCVATCTGCVISGVCYGDGQSNPTNPCLKCDKASPTAWSNNNGASCDDGKFCTVGDTCSAGACAGTTRNCSDGIACNGVETCDESNDRCVAGTSTCGGSSVCEVSSGSCVAISTCPGCVIAGVCYGEGQANPGNQCQKCARATSASAWTISVGATCNDGKFCTVGDTCSSAGACTGTTRSCDDGVACNGAETCNVTTDKCLAGTPTCTGNTVCDVTANQCVATCTGCVIGGTCYGDGQSNPINPCQQCSRTASPTAWSDKGLGTSCDDGVFCNGIDTCSGGTCGHGGSPCNGGTSCVEDKKACFMVGVPLCNADGDVIQYDANGDPARLHDCVAPSAHGTCVAGVCGCAEGYSGADCQTQDLPPSCVVRVSTSGNDANDGSTWALAVASVQQGLTLAAGKLGTGVPSCEVWVAAGVYKPTSGTDRSATFRLRANVGLYGGFAGTEVRRSQRDIEANPTVLSGDIGAPGDKSDNSYHVVTGATGGTIDGFTITAGYASGEVPNDRGGGMYNVNSSPTVTNCTFSDNSAFASSTYSDSYGGGMYNDNSSPTVTNCTFSGNSASANAQFVANSYGGGMYNVHSSPTVTNCTFLDNSAASSSYDSFSYGGGMYNASSSPTVTNCTFSGNFASASSFSISMAASVSSNSCGGGMYNASSAPTVTNCTFSGNSAASSSDAYSTGDSSSSAAAVSSSYGGGMDNANSTPTVTNCTFSGNSASSSSYSYCPTNTKSCRSTSSSDSHGGGMDNAHSTPTVTNCTLSGNSASSSASAISANAAGFPAAQSSASSYGGGMDNTNSSPTVVNSIFWGDSVTINRTAAASEFSGPVAATYSIVQGGYAGAGNVNQDPLLSPSDLRPLPGSPAIDHGTGCVSSVLATDKVGKQRWDMASVTNATGTSGVDIGAYEYQGQVSNGDTLVTPLCQVPTVTTSAATALTPASAVLNGSGIPNGLATTGWFRISTTDPGSCNDSFGTRVPATDGTLIGTGTAAVPYTITASGLTAGTPYYFCAIVSNSAGTGFGSVLSFTTSTH